VPENMLSLERLHEALDMQADGTLIWKITKKKAKIGNVAGNLGKDGYIRIKLDCVRIQAHVVVFAFTHGRFPTMWLDHINGIRNDNRPENLREVTGSQNNQNRAVPKSNTSGHKCVHWRGSKNRWVVVLRVNGVLDRQALFVKLEDAVAHRDKRFIELQGEYARKL